MHTKRSTSSVFLQTTVYEGWSEYMSFFILLSEHPSSLLFA